MRLARAAVRITARRRIVGVIASSRRAFATAANAVARGVGSVGSAAPTKPPACAAVPGAAATACPSTAAATAGGQLSHVDAATGQPAMVDISDKRVTQREATARATVYLPPAVAALFAAANSSSAAAAAGADIRSAKGPVMATAIVAGTQAVKRTADLIPFCHPLPLDSVKFAYAYADEPAEATASRVATASSAEPNSGTAAGRLTIDCRVRVTHKTGVEMEALTGASVAALTVYDMCKALTHAMRIERVELIAKTGGKSDFKAAPAPAAAGTSTSTSSASTGTAEAVAAASAAKAAPASS